jgi:hypothetical protein
MRAYLPITQKDLAAFLESMSFDSENLFAPTEQYVAENDDCDEEEIEYLLSVAAGEVALELRLSEKAPGIVLALEIEQSAIAQSQENLISLAAPITWEQVQCALLAFQGEDELVWFATQEIELHCGDWA